MKNTFWETLIYRIQSKLLVLDLGPLRAALLPPPFSIATALGFPSSARPAPVVSQMPMLFGVFACAVLDV